MATHRASLILRRLLIAVMLLALPACSSGDVMNLQPAVDVGPPVAALPQVAPAMPDSDAPDYDETETEMLPAAPLTVAYPRLEEPRTQAPLAMPAEEVACRRELRSLRVAYTDIAPIDEGGSCRVDYPIKLSAIGGIDVKPDATVNCQMALHFSRWAKKELVPSARMRYFSGVKTIHQGSSYSCRNIRGSRTASEHSKGNAIDVMRIELNNDKKIKVKKPGLFSFRERGLLNSVRADACGYFSTVLGPGYDRDHKDHFHFDIKERRNGHVACR